jgi:hypothetical protein
MAGVSNKQLREKGRSRAKLEYETGHKTKKMAKGGGVKQRGHGAAQRGFTSRGPMG